MSTCGIIFVDLETTGEFSEADRDERHREAPGLLATLILKEPPPEPSEETEKSTISTRITKRLEATCRIIRKKIKTIEVPVSGAPMELDLPEPEK